MYTLLACIMSSLLPRRKKSAADRRAQRLRAEGRLMQHMLKCLSDIGSHRGCKLSRLGEVLANTLQFDTAHDTEPETDEQPTAVQTSRRIEPLVMQYPELVS